MKIAIPVVQGKLSPHFGHCEHFAFGVGKLSAGQPGFAVIVSAGSVGISRGYSASLS